LKWHKAELTIQTRGKGLYDFTQKVARQIKEWDIQEGMCYLFLQHTSASLVVSENWDPTARQDLEAFMERLAPEDQRWHRHTLEGSDDSPSHMRAILTLPSLEIPVDDGQLNLGAWQGIYLFEHRARGHTRQVLIRCLGVE
jgi:secondary thiamine-phosphate synthase enzyme